MHPEYYCLRETAGVLDLSFRSRLCLIGADRARFLHGQVTNDIKSLTPGTGCYAALVSTKGKMETDLNVCCLEDEILLDFEPGLAVKIMDRLNRFIVADDVQVIEVSEPYGLFSVQGPAAATVVSALAENLPPNRCHSIKISRPEGDLYVVKQPRTGTDGYDIFAPVAVLDDLSKALRQAGAHSSSRDALEIARICAGIPRYGTDMDSTNFPQECGIEAIAVSYNKGCYIGQEILNRIHTMGHVNRKLHHFQIPANLPVAPGDVILDGDTVTGRITSAARPPGTDHYCALGYLKTIQGKITVHSHEITNLRPVT